MEFNEFNKKLRQEGGKIPEGLDWASMESGIKEKMEKRKKRRFPYFYFLIGFILLTQVGVIGYLLLDNKNNEATVIEENIPALEKETPLVETKSSIPSKENNTYNNTISKTKSDNNHIFSTQKITNTRILENNMGSTNQSFEFLISKNQMVDKQLNLSNSNINQPTEKIVNQEIKKLESTDENQIIISNEILMEKKEKEVQLPNIESKVGLLSELPPSYNFIFSKVKQSNYKNEFSISGGTTYNTWNPNSSVDAITRHDTEKSLISYQVNLDYKYFFPKNYFIKTGVSYHKNEYLFDYTTLSSRDTIIENVHLRNQIDTIQNTSTQIFGDTTVVASVTRQVKNYNTISSINVPLYIGKRFSLNRLFFELEGGLLLNFSTTAEGKTIDSNFEIISITENPVYKKNLGFAVGGQLNLGYAISNRLSLKAGVNAHQFISDKSEIETISFKPKSIGFIGGIGFRF